MNEARARCLGLLLAAIGLVPACGNGHAPNQALGDAGAADDAGSVTDAGSAFVPDANCARANPAGPPVQHRASAVACGLSAPPYPPYAAACGPDAGCGTIPPMQSCLPYPDAGGATFCNDDQCFTDSDCPSGPCGCSRGTMLYGSANLCFSGNCHTDADCGSRGYCSPSSETACQGGDFAGVVAYYCHTAKDECINDSDCASCGSGAYCAMTLLGFWQCITPSQLPMCPAG